jgi:hypothetical protein
MQQKESSMVRTVQQALRIAFAFGTSALLFAATLV